jgi:predicted Zn-dependent peptidase
VLSRELRYKRGLVYSVGASASGGVGYGQFRVLVSCAPEHAQNVLNIIIKELRRIISSGINPEQLRFIKESYRKGKIRGMQTSNSWLVHDYNCLMDGENPKTIIDDERDFVAVTTLQTRTAATQYFTKDNWYLTVCGPENARKLTVRL